MRDFLRRLRIIGASPSGKGSWISPQGACPITNERLSGGAFFSAVTVLGIVLFVFAFSLGFAFGSKSTLLPIEKIALVGDSWASGCPVESLETYKYAQVGASVEEIREMVERAPPVEVDKVLIIAGLANVARHKAGIEETKDELFGLACLCKRKFSARTVIVYDPDVMLEFLKHREYRRDAFHLHPGAYEAFLATEPLFVLSPPLSFLP